MRIDRTLPLKLSWAIYAVMWFGGVLRAQDTGWAAPLFLFIAGVIALLSAPADWKPLLVTGAIGFALETLGVHTGFPFGRYLYTGKLGISLLGVPLVIACAWMVMFAFVRQLTSHVWMAAALLTATDLLIDPVASGVLDYWRWLHPGLYFGVPVSNFLGWFAAGLLLFTLPWPRAQKNASQLLLGASILLFFAARAIPI